MGVTGSESPQDDNATVSGIALLSGLVRTCSAQEFRGGEMTAIMGGFELDLRQAAMKEGEAVIDVFAFWGGIEIKVPTEWAVVVKGTPFMGGFDDKTRVPQGGSNKRLIINGYAIMGGVEITN